MVSLEYKAINSFCPVYKSFSSNDGEYLEVENGRLIRTQGGRPSWIIHVVDKLFPLSQIPVEQREQQLKGIERSRLESLNEFIVEFSKPNRENRTENAMRAEKLGLAIQEILDLNQGRRYIIEDSDVLR